MKHISLLLFCLMLSSSLAAQEKHVILISIDGLRPDFYQDESWPAPNLRQLAEEGVQATGVQSVFPSLTYPSHTSMITGALPARHGIHFNVPLEAKKGRYNWEDSLIKVETLWAAMEKVNMKSAAVMWPVTVGAPVDYNFPIRRPDAGEKLDELSLTRPLVSPEWLLQEFEREYGDLHPDDFKEDKHRQDSVVTNLAMHIFNTHKPALTALHFLSMDKAQHKHGREGQQVKESMKVVDRYIGKIIREIEEAGMKENTTILIIGDHGFVNTTTGFSPNVLLAKHGLLRDEGWKAKFYTAGGSAFLYVKNNDQQTLEQVLDILESLPAEQRQLFEIVKRSGLDNAGANEDAVLGLAMSKGVRANGRTSGFLVQRNAQGGHHGSFPDFEEIETGFIAWGAGVENNKTISNIGVEDIAPLVAFLLEIPFEAPDGELKKEIIRHHD